MKRLILILLVFCIQSGHSQVLFQNLPLKDSIRHQIKSVTVFESNSNKLPNSMLATLLWGGYMDQQYLTNVRDKLKNSGNRFGFQVHSQLNYQWKSKAHEWVAGVKYREMFGLKFSKDLFGLGFLGNGQYEGQEADISNTKLGYWNYTCISLGMIEPLDSNSNLFVGVSFLYGLNQQSLTTKKTSIYTASDGEYIGTSGDLNVGYKEPGYGLGFAVNSSYSFKEGKNSLLFSIEDLGIMQFQKYTTYRGQSENKYYGFDATNVKNFSADSMFSDFSSKGFAKKFNVTEDQKSTTVLMPFIVLGTYNRSITKTVDVSAEVYYTYMPAYIPKISARVHKLLDSTFQVSAGLSYGGFGNQNFLLGLKKDFRKNWSFQLESYFLGIAIAPKNTTGGLGVSVGLSKGF